MSRNLKRRLRGTSLLLTLAAMVALIVYIACSNSTTPYAPLGKDTPKPGSGDVVSGAVRDQGQTAVKGAIVSIETLTNGVPATALALMEHPELASKLASQAATTSDATHRVTLTDERGRFYFDGMAPGQYAIQVRADDHLGASANVAVPNTPQALDTIIVNVNLTPTGTFSGVATLENGTVHQDIVVFCQGTSYVAVTAPNGAYALTDVPVGSYTIRATKSHYIDDTKNGTLTFAGQNLGVPAMFLRLDNNISPVATATVVTTPPYTTGSPITFQAAGSDLDGTVVKYEWDWENDGVMDASSASPGTTPHTYAAVGVYTVKLRVTDNLGGIGLDAKTITVNAPVITEIYMSPTGSDSNPGTQLNPVLTLNKAYQLAQLNTVTLVRAAQGTYTEVPNFIAGINVQGGFDGTTWTPDAGYTKFNVGTVRATANSITSATTIHRIEIATTAPGPGNNSIALFSQGSSLALVFDSCIFRASNGGPALTPGSSGGAGTAGSPGSPGVGIDCDTDGPGGPGGPGGSSPACAGGNGGKGGANGTNSGQGGFAAPCSGGGTGGLPGSGGDPGGPGSNGNPGANGSYGGLGTPVSANGAIVGTNWAPGVGGPGGAGTDGKGGGGGGGGGGQGCFFCNDGQGNGGGGGGGAGVAGGGGNGGPGGFGSIAILLIASSPTFQSCQIFTASGGSGLSGGAGGDGGLGGTGGNGGKGGDAGGGGGGAGGAGGPS